MSSAVNYSKLNVYVYICFEVFSIKATFVELKKLIVAGYELLSLYAYIQYSLQATM